ncbi:2'-5' RNA ligase [Methylocella silvestris BL2]|uniref:RNA 2',3'-cyclic phosphodiesterase n=1 Tax=Methylocella silvestris (strain DSM 15510 / CIP 108128 / LMG 27833 / NCIMB 13906 / BL2) TaxID=395965 RepID=B8ENT1_METSB|nr:RNA 2',3'-cyclic phosphodiesterase [Methylocella silvestris]ACK50867.1 2'-5' RNA ligase [Methylocella silvestris BL2]
MPRLFTGIEIPPEVATDLSLMRGGIYGARWIDVENYHITLRFIGDIDDSSADDVHMALEQIRRKPFEVTLETLGSFGGDKPRAIVAKAKPAAPLVELQAQQERLLRRIGIAPEPRKFTPHVTLARLRAASSMAVADYLSTRGFFFSRRFEASRFVLFSSRASTGGGPYVVEAAYPLG